MKKILALAFLCLLALTAFNSCGSRGGHCDAYGNIDTVQANDLAAK
jgi:hypothetical protein